MLHIRLNIRSGLVHILEDSHFLLYDFDALLTTGIVLENELFFLLQDLLNYSLVVLTKLLNVVGIFGADFIEGGHTVAKALSFGTTAPPLLLRLRIPILPALEELTLGFLEVRLLAQLLPTQGRRLTHTSEFGIRLLQGRAWVAILSAQEVATIVPTRCCLDHGTEEDLLVPFLHGISGIRTFAHSVRLRALQSLLEAAHLTLQALHHRFLIARLGSLRLR